MSQLLVKNAGEWIKPKNIFAKQNGTWINAKAVWVKNNGVWIQSWSSMPSNMIVLYDDASHIPTDATIVSTLVGRFPLGASTYGGTGGADTHAGSAHGASSASSTSSVVGGGGQQGTTGITQDPNTYHDSHYHTFGHTHSDTASNLPAYIDAIPTLGGAIGAGSVWLTTQSSMPALFAAYTTALTRYLRLNNGYSIGGSATHGHAYSGNTSGPILVTPHSATLKTNTSGSHATGSHTHAINHTHTLSNDQSYVNANIYKAISNIGFTDLPSGTLAFFTDATLPDGWSRYTVADGRLIKCVNTSIGATGGSTTHTHASESFTTGVPSGVFSSGSVGAYGTTTHTHTINHGHLTAVDWMPPYTGIVIGVKS